MNSPSRKNSTTPSEWLAPQEAAEKLGCSEETVRAMLDDGLFSGKKVKGEWWVNAVEVEWIQSIKLSAPLPEPSVSSSLLKVDPGMVEVSIALAGVATAIAAFLPGIDGIPEILKLVVATVPSAVALISAYGALWLLARYCLPRDCLTGESLLGIAEVWTLLKNWYKIGPYMLIVGGLLFLLALSVFLGILAFMR
jgi:hypothetical protein